MNRLANYALAFAAAALLGACHGAKSSPIVQNAPDWVNKGNGAFKDQAGNKVFYGVGILAGVRNPGLAVSAVEALAASAGRYTSIEIDLGTGRRGARAAFAEGGLAQLAGAEAALKSAAEKLLANTVIENYRIELR